MSDHRSALASRQDIDILREEMRELQEQGNVRRQEADSGVVSLQHAWLQKWEPLNEEVSRVTRACNDSTARMDMIFDEVAALRQLAAPSASVERQHGGQDLALIKQEVRLSLEGLQEDVKALEMKIHGALETKMHAALRDAIEAQPGVRHEQPTTSILKELRDISEQTQQHQRLANDVLSRVSELGAEHHAVRSSSHRESEGLDAKLDELQRQIDLTSTKSQQQAKLLSDGLKQLQEHPASQEKIATGILAEVEALKRLSAAGNQGPDAHAQQDMVASVTNGMDILMKLSTQVQDRVNSVVEQVEDVQRAQGGSRDFVTHETLRDELGPVTRSAAEGHTIAKQVFQEMDGLRQEMKNMKDVNLETRQPHPSIAELQESEDRELRAYTQVLSRLDELDERLETFETTVAGHGSSTAPAHVVKGRGIPAEFAEQSGNLIDRLAEFHDTEEKLIAKIKPYSANVEALGPMLE